MSAAAPVPRLDKALLEKALARIACGGEGAVADLAPMIACNTSFPPGTGYALFADLMAGRVAPPGVSPRPRAVPAAPPV